MGYVLTPIVEGAKAGAKKGAREAMISVSLPFAAVWRLFSTTSRELEARIPTAAMQHRDQDREPKLS